MERMSHAQVAAKNGIKKYNMIISVKTGSSKILPSIHHTA
jgi:hypothetical protein